ncbi:MAG: phosphate acyltransferase PlsX [Chloroflexi bacterium]|nr:phosphate acyltransferase PlsX [Chloroflexota bacterium]
MRIVLDAMGSDQHPEPEVQAALQASREFDEPLILVGDRQVLAPMLGSAKNIELVHADEVFEMSDHISHGVLRRVKNSMGVGMDLISNGEADALVTAGNTAGALGIGLARLKRMKGVRRPALSVLFPTASGHCVVLDIGANAECKPEYLLQFALMGSVYAEQVLGVKNPRVGLVSNGEEAGKGNELVKETYPLLEASSLNFIGNVEGKEIFGGDADVAVTDGFTGNVLMKGSEAVAKFITDRLRTEMMASTRTKIGGLLARPAFNELRKDLDSRQVGAAPLLGLNGLVFVGHGRSDGTALFSAIKLARQSVKVGLINSLREAIESALEVA